MKVILRTYGVLLLVGVLLLLILGLLKTDILPNYSEFISGNLEADLTNNSNTNVEKTAATSSDALYTEMTFDLISKQAKKENIQIITSHQHYSVGDTILVSSLVQDILLTEQGRTSSILNHFDLTFYKYQNPFLIYKGCYHDTFRIIGKCLNQDGTINTSKPFTDTLILEVLSEDGSIAKKSVAILVTESKEVF